MIHEIHPLLLHIYSASSPITNHGSRGLFKHNPKSNPRMDQLTTIQPCEATMQGNTLSLNYHENLFQPIHELKIENRFQTRHKESKPQERDTGTMPPIYSHQHHQPHHLRQNWNCLTNLIAYLTLLLQATQFGRQSQTILLRPSYLSSHTDDRDDDNANHSEANDYAND